MSSPARTPDEALPAIAAARPAAAVPARAASALLLALAALAIAAVALADVRGGARGFGVRQTVLAVAGLAAGAWGVELWGSDSRRMTWRRVATALGALRLVATLVVVAEIAAVLLLVRALRIESPVLYDTLVPLAGIGFAANLVVPAGRRLAFFAALCLTAIYAVLGARDGTALIGVGLLLIGACHLPLRWGARVAIVAAMGGVLAFLRTGLAAVPWSDAVWPVLGSMFMFRTVLYLHALRHGRGAQSPARSLGYFFMLPNLTFPLFPVVDFATFRRTYYDRDALEIYSEGARWMARGVLHLVAYRAVYQFVAIGPEDVSGIATLGRYMVGTFLLYLRVSGSFHLIVGMLHLFGFRLPETHRFFYLASSFSDFWRRINIYWKDFMSKVVFYPAYFRFRKRGERTALVIATLGVFFATWLLHAYQWFWLLGTALLSWPDLIFWAVLAVLLVGNALLERGRSGRASGAEPPGLRGSATLALRISLTFIVICTLWSLWSSPTLADFAALVSRARLTLAGVAGAMAAVVASVFVLVLAFGRHARSARGAALAERAGFTSNVVAAAVPLALLALVASPAASARVPLAAQAALFRLRVPELNEHDARLMRRGYYEDLARADRLGGQLAAVYARRPVEWTVLWETPLATLTGDFMRVRLVPGAQALHHGAPVRINRWGMRDRDYERIPEPGTARIAILGASYVMGDGVADDEVFDAVAERAMNDVRPAGAPRVELMNFAVSSLHPSQQLALLDSGVFAFRPGAVVLVAHGGNDIESADHVGGQVARGNRIPYPFMADIARRAGVTVGMRAADAERRMAPYRDELLAATYARIAEACRSRGIAVYWLYLDIPTAQDVRPERDRVLRLARGAGFDALFDLSGVYDGRDRSALQVAPWDFHPNADGHRLIAARFRRLLEEGGVIARAAGAVPAPPTGREM